MKVFIIEDEPLGVERLEKQLREIDASIQILGVGESIQSSVKWLNQHEQPDLIFMDIELADGQSFDIFRQTEIKSPVIFTTSYDEYALRAFKVNSIDYLLKPIKKEELKNGIEKFKNLKKQFAPTPELDIQKLLNGLRQQPAKEYRNRFLVKQGQRLISIEVADIAYFYIDERVTFFRTWDKARYTIDYTMDDLETMLNPKEFYRVNRSFISHSKAIAQIHYYFNNKLKLELTPAIDKEVLVSRENAADFKNWMGR